MMKIQVIDASAELMSFIFKNVLTLHSMKAGSHGDMQE